MLEDDSEDNLERFDETADCPAWPPRPAGGPSSALQFALLAGGVALVAMGMWVLVAG